MREDRPAAGVNRTDGGTPGGRICVQRRCFRAGMLADDGTADDAYEAGSFVVRDVGRTLSGTLPVVVNRLGGRCGHAGGGAWVRRTRYVCDTLLLGAGHAAPPAGSGQLGVHDTLRATAVKIIAALHRGVNRPSTCGQP